MVCLILVNYLANLFWVHLSIWYKGEYFWLCICLFYVFDIHKYKGNLVCLILSFWITFRLIEVLCASIFLLFIRPFEKRDVLCRGNVRPSVCPSVRPSVRPRFPDFSSTCFEISIWNLVYTFSRWHDMSSLSCITIGSFWPSLQPKVGETYFLQSWPHKSR